MRTAPRHPAAHPRRRQRGRARASAWMRGRAAARQPRPRCPRAACPVRACAGRRPTLPFADGTFDVVSAFDVVEHCDRRRRAVAELARVLAPGGRMLLSVPAYQWAWRDHDVQAGHHRRYTRRRLRPAGGGRRDAGRRATYAFSGVFPLFVAERLRTPAASRPPPGDTRLPQVSPRADRVLMGLSPGGRARAPPARPALRLVGAPGRGQARRPARAERPRRATTASATGAATSATRKAAAVTCDRRQPANSTVTTAPALRRRAAQRRATRSGRSRASAATISTTLATASVQPVATRAATSGPTTHGAAEDQPQQAGPEPAPKSPASGTDHDRERPEAPASQRAQPADGTGDDVRRDALGQLRQRPERRPCRARGTAPARRTSRSPRRASRPAAPAGPAPPVSTACASSCPRRGAAEERERRWRRHSHPAAAKRQARTATARPARPRRGPARGLRVVHLGHEERGRRGRSARRSRRPG